MEGKKFEEAGGKSPPPVEERSRGALLGLAVGDAFGTTLEFSEPKAPPFPQLAPGPHVEIVGVGPFRVVPGQVTDDTQMACCLAASLAERGDLDVADLAARYVAWQEHAFDVGVQTAAALNAIREGTPPARAGREVWLGASRPPAGNGSLMRTAPIGVFFAEDARRRREAALSESALTHYDPRCRLACAAFDAAIAEAVLGAGDPSALHEAAQRELWHAAAVLRAEPGETTAAVSGAMSDLEEDLAAATRADPQLYGPSVHLHRQQGWVRVAFRLAFWELLHAPTWRDGVVDAVNRGGDADTNGAIAGALLGAYHGEGAIPEAWRERVLGAVPREPGPLRDAYHPKALVRAFEAWRARGGEPAAD
jgi:ADP-ribosyl-[dinitrogen reductase] hydrolase